MTKTKTTIKFSYLFITSQTTTITTNCSQLSNGKWTVFQLNLIHNITIRHKLPSKMTSLTSLLDVASKITGILISMTWRNCASEYSRYYFAITQAESHAHITRNPTFQKTTTVVDIKITHTNTNTNKIHEMQGVKFLQINIVRYTRPNSTSGGF